MNKELKEMIKKQYETDSRDFEPIKKILDMFSYTTEDNDKALVTAASEKLADIFTIEVLKSMDRHIVPTSVLQLMLSANTVSDYEILNAIQTMSEEDVDPYIILMMAVELGDGSEILITNIREAYDETD